SDWCRQTAIAGQIAREVFEATDETRASCFYKFPERNRIAQHRIRRCRRVNEERDDKARAFGIALVHFCLIYEAVEGTAPSEVALRKRAVNRALLPCRIGKALILGIGSKF